MLGDVPALCVCLSVPVFSAPKLVPGLLSPLSHTGWGRAGLGGSRGPGSWDWGRDLAWSAAHPASAEHGAL